MIRLLLVLACASGAVYAGSPDDPYRDWGEVLERHVDDEGRTNFDALHRERAALDRFVAWVGTTGPTSRPELFPDRAAVLAHHINTYNALAMAGIIDAGMPAAFDGVIKRARFFKFRKVRVDGATTSLYDYENDIIRPLGDPRVHFALNCMVRDCPRLPREPFRGPTLEPMLDRLTREFFDEPKHLRIDHGTRTILVSAILDFYTEDFAGSGDPASLIGYISRYRATPLPAGYRVRFLKYDWTVNRQP